MFLFQTKSRTKKGPGNAAAFVAVAAVLLAVGCQWTEQLARGPNAKTETAAANTGTAKPGVTPDEQITASGPCQNEYYPVDPEAKRLYEIRGIETDSFTLKQSEPSESRFTETRTFDSGPELSINWICGPEGLRTAEFLNTLMMQNARFTMETVRSEGLTIPKEMKVGSEFEAVYDIKANLNAGPVKAAATGKVTISNKVGALDETVTAGGKEYQAARIDSTIKISLSMGGRSVPGATVTMKNWYAPGVGRVKEVTGGTYGKQTVELISIDR